MKKESLVKIMVLLLGLLLITVSLGCDGLIDFEGKAFEWVDAPEGAQGMVFISKAIRKLDDDGNYDTEQSLQTLIDSIPKEIKVVPLGAVKITVESKEGGDETTFSNVNGDFKHSSVTAPGNFKISLKASKDGYINVFGETEHDWEYVHVLVVILVKKSYPTPY